MHTSNINVTIKKQTYFLTTHWIILTIQGMKDYTDLRQHNYSYTIFILEFSRGRQTLSLLN